MKKISCNPLIVFVVCAIALSGCNRSKSKGGGQRAAPANVNAQNIPPRETWTAEQVTCADLMASRNQPIQSCFNPGAPNLPGGPGFPGANDQGRVGPWVVTKIDKKTKHECEKRRADRIVLCKQKSVRSGQKYYESCIKLAHSESDAEERAYEEAAQKAEAARVAAAKEAAIRAEKQRLEEAARAAQAELERKKAEAEAAGNAGTTGGSAPVVNEKTSAASEQRNTPAETQNKEQQSNTVGSGTQQVAKQTQKQQQAQTQKTAPEKEQEPEQKKKSPAKTKREHVLALKYIVYQDEPAGNRVTDEEKAVFEAAFKDKALFSESIRNPAKKVSNADYNISAKAVSTQAAPVISEELAEAIIANLRSAKFPNAPILRACDVRVSGPCVVLEKDSASGEPKYKVFLLGTDHVNEKHEPLKTPIYRRIDLHPTLISMAEKALSKRVEGIAHGDGFYVQTQLLKSDLDPQSEEQGTQQPVEAKAPPAAAPDVTPPVPQTPAVDAGTVDDAQARAEYDAIQEEAINRQIAKCERSLNRPFDDSRRTPFVRPNETLEKACKRETIIAKMNKKRAKLESKYGLGVFGTIVHACAVKITYQIDDPVFLVGVNRQHKGSGVILCKQLPNGPVTRKKIYAEENIKLSLLFRTGSATHDLIATGFGWANGADGVFKIGNYKYLFSAHAGVPIAGGVGVTPLIYGNNKERGQGPVFAFAASWALPGLDNQQLNASLDLFGTWSFFGDDSDSNN